MRANIEKNSIWFLILLLLGDLAFVFVHIAYLNGFLWDRLFSIEVDRGYAEVFQYIKEYWIAVLLFVLAIKNRQAVYFAWSVLFVYLFLDDSLRIHESIGRYLVDSYGLQPMFRLRAQDFGELAVSAVSGTLLFGFVGACYFASEKAAREASKTIFILVMVVAAFGVLVDMLHIAIPWGKSIMGLIEDGGEMVTMSVIAWFVFDLMTERKEPNSSPSV